MHYMKGPVEKITGYPVEDILENKHVSFVGLTHPDDVDPTFAAVDAAIARNQPWDVVYRLIHRNGDHIWVRDRGKAVFDVQGEVSHLEGLIVSASAEMELREQLNQTLADKETANAEILKLAENILYSIKKLSLLSVNARIEAARAGDAGLGFAYVASEISTLADESTKLATQISARMEADAG